MNALPGISVSALFITIDPQRDTLERLSAYVPHFHSDMIGLTGTDDEIRSVAEQYNVAFKRIGQGETYSMEHTSHIFVLDQFGAIRALAPFGSSVDHLITLIRGVVGEDG